MTPVISVAARGDAIVGRRQGEETMKVSWYGTATVSLDCGATKLLFDPFQRKNKKLPPLEPARFKGHTALLLTHGHFDHLSGVPAVLRENPAMPVYCTKTPAAMLEKKGVPRENLRLIAPGDRFHAGDVEVKVHAGRHISFNPGYILSVLPKCAVRFPQTFYLLHLIRVLPENGEIVAFELTAEGKTVFLMGSFGVDGSVEYPKHPSLFVFPFSGNSLIARAALPFLERLRPKNILFDHFDDSFPPLTPRMDVEAFCRQLAASHPDVGLIIPTEGEEYDVP